MINGTSNSSASSWPVGLTGKCRPTSTQLSFLWLGRQTWEWQEGTFQEQLFFLPPLYLKVPRNSSCPWKRQRNRRQTPIHGCEKGRGAQLRAAGTCSLVAGPARYCRSPSSTWLSSYRHISSQWYSHVPLRWNVLVKCSHFGSCLFFFLRTKPDSSPCIAQHCLKMTSDTGLATPFREANLQPSPVLNLIALASGWRAAAAQRGPAGEVIVPLPCTGRPPPRSPSLHAPAHGAGANLVGLLCPARLPDTASRQWKKLWTLSTVHLFVSTLCTV